MHVTFICRKNEVRSTFAQLLAHNQFPEIETDSAGIEVNSHPAPLSSVFEIAIDWGLQKINLVPTSILEKRRFIESSELVIIADESLRSSLSVLKINGKVRSFADYIFDESFMPQDPLGFTADKLRVEVAKVAYSSIRAIESELNISSTYGIKVVIPNNSTDCDLAFEHAQFERQQNDGFLIDCDLRSPYATDHGSSENYVFYNPLEINISKDAFLNKSKIWASYKEFSRPETILISRDWRNQIRELADIAPVTLITAPRYIEGKRVVDSYMASAVGNEISIISC
jgi:protein-tyrosine-phosphatase